MKLCKELKTGCSFCEHRPLTPRDFADYAEGGVEVMELSINSDMMNGADWNMLSRADRCGIEVRSVHLPFDMGIDPANLDAQIRKNTLEHDGELIKRFSEWFGSKIFVIHACLEPVADGERAERLKYSRESLSALADTAAGVGGVIAVENLPRSCLGNTAAEMLWLTENDPRLRFCFDTNHLLLESHEVFVSAIADRTVTLHVSDYDFRNERHWMPGEGKIDWPKLISLLENNGYEGPFMYEVGLLPSRTIERRTLTRRDFRENHMELARYRTPAPLGTPIKAGMDASDIDCGIK